MSRYQFTPQATDDLFNIWSYVAHDNPDAADRIERAILRACELLCERPRAGNVRADLTALPLRFWPVQPYRNYLIVYDAQTKPLRIIRILHGARDLAFILK